MQSTSSRARCPAGVRSQEWLQDQGSLCVQLWTFPPVFRVTWWARFRVTLKNLSPREVKWPLQGCMAELVSEEGDICPCLSGSGAQPVPREVCVPL
jgi:hypothetical protein